MCGRFTQMMSWRELWELYQLPGRPPESELRPNYNVAPTQDVVTIRQDADGQREAVRLHWGLIPHWAKEKSIGNRTINARGETVASKPSFRAAFKRRRCLVPASGFYEWKRTDQSKVPHYIHHADGLPLTFAGLWEHWKGPDGPVESCTIITTDANERIAELHNRMPVALEQPEWEPWLDPQTPPEKLAGYLEPRPWPWAQFHPVSTRVNNARNNDPSVLGSAVT